MAAALTPAIALEYLCELSADVRAGIVLGAGGARLAGPAALAGPGAAAIAELAEGEAAQALRPDGAVLALRGTGAAIVLACGPRVLPEVVRHDLRLVLADLGAAVPAAPAAARELPAPLAAAVLSAAQSGVPVR